MIHTALVSHPDCLRHEMGASHPECPARMEVISDSLSKAGITSQLLSIESPLADPLHLSWVHDKDYVDMVFDAVPSKGYTALDADTLLNPHSLNAARRAAGAGIAAVDAVCQKTVRNAFCLVRPCGHHATYDQAMGFCIFNNIAVAVAYALRTYHLKRVAIVDFDVHHGNGTEDIFSAPIWQESVFMAGFFQSPFYPYSGVSPLSPNMMNIPLQAGTKGAIMRQKSQATWLPALDNFAPEMIFISAGFDAHQDDLLGGLALEDTDYVWLTKEIQSIAERHADGKIVSMLEGGYSLPALGRSATAHVATLAGL